MCDDGFNNNAANAICRFMGLEVYSDTLTFIYYLSCHF